MPDSKLYVIIEYTLSGEVVADQDVSVHDDVEYAREIAECLTSEDAELAPGEEGYGHTYRVCELVEVPDA